MYYDTPEPLPKKNPGQTWVALLIDGDGLHVWLDKALSAAEDLGEVVVKRIYGNYHIDSKYTQWAGIYRKYHFDQRIMLGVHRNIADMSIVAEAG